MSDTDSKLTGWISVYRGVPPCQPLSVQPVRPFLQKDRSATKEIENMRDRERRGDGDDMKTRGREGEIYGASRVRYDKENSWESGVVVERMGYREEEKEERVHRMQGKRKYGVETEVEVDEEG